MTKKDEFLLALSNFDIDEVSHSLIYTEPNELVEMGFPAEFIHDLFTVHESSSRYIYQFEGKPVSKLVGITHASLIWAIAKEIGADTSVAANFTGEGFRVDAIVREIRKVMDQHNNG